ncbi:MAG: serine--tRNA ligase [Alphaproteobacteria bacterium]|nr:serine--tRNA ligase [Alphaproteobacteria bacterium]
MLDIQFVLANKELVIEMMRNRQKEPVDMVLLQSLYSERQIALQEVEKINREKKITADARDIEKGKTLKEEAHKKETHLSDVTKRLTEMLYLIPNMPLADVPIGKNDSENIVLREWGDKKVFSFPIKPHWELGIDLNIIDTERATKISGSRFAYIKGELVRIQFALLQLLFDVVTSQEELKKIIIKNNLSTKDTPFIPVLPPVIINPEYLHGMGRLDPKEDKYYLAEDNQFLTGSAEHTLGPMHTGEIFKEEQLPLRYIGYSTAFRREAGSYGKDTKGILRQHQFDKAEMETFSLPQDSKNEQDLLVAIQEHLLQVLQLPYRVMAVCTGDMGSPDARQIDIETWMPGQGVYRETHSADLVGEYQSRRLGIKFDTNGKKEFVHMNDATAFAMGRMLIAIMENYQEEDGSIAVPQVLRKYCNFEKINPLVS